MGTWEGPGRIRDLEIHAVDRLLVREEPGNQTANTHGE